jgi:hypothetical protein
MIDDRERLRRPSAGASRTGLRRRLRHGLVAAGLTILWGCSSSGQSGSAFVFLSVDLFSLDGATAIGFVSASRADSGSSTAVCATLRNNLKNPTVTAPTGLDNILIESYTVTLTRLDGGPVPGPFTFVTAITVPAGTVSGGAVSGNTATLGVVVIPAQSKTQSPLNGAALPLNMTALMTFKGRDGRGSRVEASGGVSIVLIGSGTDPVPACVTPVSSSSSSVSSSESSASSI